jgi:imidazole glycerol-phosphate synthase subunit HisH
MKIVIVDYGMGNIKSITSALKYLKVDDIVISNKPDDIQSADKLILPGVGSFTKAMANIKKLNLDKILHEVVIENKKPILGICLGMQLMGQSSEEDGFSDGLKFIDSNVKKFNIKNLKVPHVGFNQVEFYKDYKLYKGLDNLSDFYFTHSYQMHSDQNINQSFCEYGDKFIVSYEVENILGVQFHPELSQTNGLKLLENFIKNF